MDEFSIPKRRNKNLISVSKLYTYCLITSPILFTYGVGIGTLTLIDVILLVLNLLLFFRGLLLGKINIQLNMLPFFIYVIITMLFHELDNNAILRTLRYAFYLFNIIFFAKNHFNYKYGVKLYRAVSLISTTFLFIQLLFFKILGLYIPGVILSANLIATDLYDYNRVLQQAQYKRFMSFFEEPSHYAIYILGYLVILLFSKVNINRNVKTFFFEVCFLSLGIAFSTSILGVMVLLAMLSIWIGKNFIKNKKSFIKIIFFIIIFIGVVFFISNTSSFEYFTNRNIVSKQAGGRFGGYNIVLADNTNSINVLFGRGMVSNEYGIFLASYPLLIYYFGYVGLLIFISSFTLYFIKFKFDVSTALLICIFGIALGSEILLGRFILLYFPLIFKGKQKSR